jgi:hypothetical protein
MCVIFLPIENLRRDATVDVSHVRNSREIHSDVPPFAHCDRQRDGRHASTVAPIAIERAGQQANPQTWHADDAKIRAWELQRRPCVVGKVRSLEVTVLVPTAASACRALN